MYLSKNQVTANLNSTWHNNTSFSTAVLHKNACHFNQIGQICWLGGDTEFLHIGKFRNFVRRFYSSKYFVGGFPIKIETQIS